MAGATARLLDLSTYGVEKLSLVFEIGAAYTKCGFAGEPSPRFILPSKTQWRGQEVAVLDPACGLSRTPIEQREILLNFFHDLLYTYLLVKAHDRRVIICESMYMPEPFRKALAEVLFSHYLAASLLFVPLPLVALLPLGIESALVVDCGFHETAVVGVSNGSPVIASMTTTPHASAAVESRLTELILSEGKVEIDGASKMAAELTKEIPPRMVEDIKTRACLAGRLPEGAALPPLSYPFFGGKLEISANMRTHAVDALYEGGVDDESVAAAILQALQKCPVDLRTALAGRITLLGGTSMLPGFAHRLHEELQALVQEDAYAALRGTSGTRTRVTVVLVVTEGEPDQAALFADRHKIQYHVLGSCGLAVEDVEAFEVALTDDGKVSASFSFDEIDTSKLSGLIITGQRGYTVETVDSVDEVYRTGVEDAFGFYEHDFAPNSLGWLGASIVGTINDLVLERSLTREDYNKCPILPEWTRLGEQERIALGEANASSALAGASDKPAAAAMLRPTFTHTPWQRPREWAYGQIAGPPAPPLVP